MLLEKKFLYLSNEITAEINIHLKFNFCKTGKIAIELTKQPSYTLIYLVYTVMVMFLTIDIS